MRMYSKEDIKMMREFDAAVDEPEPLLESTTRPDVVTAIVRERAEMPEFGVNYN
jgi:hypothetical protein